MVIGHMGRGMQMEDKDKVPVLAVQQVFQSANSYTVNYKLFSRTYNNIIRTL